MTWAHREHKFLFPISTFGTRARAEAAAHLLGDRRPLLMVTDPRYGIELDSKWRDRVGLNGYVWHARLFTREVLSGLLRIGFLYPQQIIWNRGHMVLTRTHYWYQHEPCPLVNRNGTGAGKSCVFIPILARRSGQETLLRAALTRRHRVTRSLGLRRPAERSQPHENSADPPHLRE